MEGFVGRDRGYRSLSFLPAKGLALGEVDYLVYKNLKPWDHVPGAVLLVLYVVGIGRPRR